MVLQLKSLFAGEVSVLPFCYHMEVSSLDQQGLTFQQPVKVTGQVESHAGMVMLSAAIEYCYEVPCDRCLIPIHRNGTLQCQHVLVTHLNQEETADVDELVLVKDFQLDLDELMFADLYLNLPTKNLCKPDCRGLCPSCGKNLNQGDCHCQEDDIDPRLAALKDLLS